MRTFTLVLMAGLAFASTPAAALYDDLEFTPIMTDPEDHVGFYDLTGMAVAEDGLDNVIFRIDVIDPTLLVPGLSSYLIWRFTDGTTAFDPGVNADGSPTSFGGSYDPEACQVDGSSYYCSIAYSTLGVGIGTVLAENWLTSYAQAAQDYAPGDGGFIPNQPLGLYGSDYQLVGSTRKDGAPPPPVDGEVVFDVVEGNEVDIQRSFAAPTNVILVYNWTSPEAALDATFNATVDGGLIRMAIVEDDEPLWTADLEASDEVFQSVTGTGALWNVAFSLEGFKGRFSMSIVEADEDGPTPTPATGATNPTRTTGATPPTGSQNQVTNPTGADGGDDEGSPGVGAALLAAALVAAVVLRRRRA